MEEIKSSEPIKEEYSADTNFNDFEFDFETKLKIEIVAESFKHWYHPTAKIKLYKFLKNNISGDSKEYFIKCLFKDEKDKDTYFDVVLETNTSLITA